MWRVQGAQRKAELRDRLGELLLRRTKEGTIRDQLPRKADFICVCELSDLQLRAYQCAPLPHGRDLSIVACRWLLPECQLRSVHGSAQANVLH